MSIRHLVNPSPNDANLRVQSDNLGMLREGETDLDRYFFYAGKVFQKMELVIELLTHSITQGLQEDIIMMEQQFLKIMS